jgi:hypothetical protein
MYKQQNIMKTNRNYLRSAIGFACIGLATQFILITPSVAQITVYGNSFTVAPGGVVNSVGPITIADSGSIDNSGTIHVGGDWTNNGSGLTKASPGIVEFNGSNSQDITGSQTTTFSTLTINNASSVALKKDIVVDQLLTFTTGKLSAGSNNVTLSSPSTQIVGADSEKYVITLSTGVVKRIVSGLAADTGRAMLFPVGWQQYAPVSLTFSDISKDPSTVSCRVENAIDVPIGGVDQNSRCNEIWELGAEPQTILGPCVATFDLASTINTGDIEKYVLMKWDVASGWTRPTSVVSRQPPILYAHLGGSFGIYAIGEPSGSDVKSPKGTSLASDDVYVNRVVPNPGSSVMTFAYTLGKSEEAKLELFNTLGESIAILADGYQTQGLHQVQHNMSALSDGTYYLRLSNRSAQTTAVVKVIH